MKALLFNKENLMLQEIPKPVPRKGEALLKVRKAGICGTDLAIVSGDYRINSPVVLGHEIFGEIEKLNGQSRLPTGSRVVTEINISCGACSLCKSGLRNHCGRIGTIGMDRQGGFAEHVSAPIENLHPIPDSISDEEAVFVEPLAAALQVTKMSNIDRGSTCAVVGVGRLGLLILQALKIQKPKVLAAFTRRPKGLGSELARSFGAKVVALKEARQFVRALTGGAGFDHVVEASGSPSGLGLAMKLVRPRGTVHVKSTHGLPVRFDLTEAVVREVRIQGSRCGPFEEAIALLKKRKVSTQELITHRFSLDEFEKAFSIADSRKAIKVLFSP